MGAFLDNLRLALGTLVSNPLRTMLTLLGIVIGVATVVSMMALIEGLRIKVNKDLSSLGANSFEVSKWPSGFGNFDWNRLRKRPALTIADLEAISRLESVAQVSAMVQKGGEKISNALAETRPNVGVIGATPGYVDTASLSIVSGRFLSEPDHMEARKVVVIGADVADLLFPKQDPVGKEVRVGGRPYHVIGLIARRGSFLGMGSMDNLVVIPLRTFEGAFGAGRSYELGVQALDAAQMDAAKDEVTALMRGRHRLEALVPDDFEINTNESMTGTFNSLSQVITLASFGVCLLSLVVGGIGILNIMLMSVTERTKEIGIRKALGAKKRRILGQFATEAIVLSLVGGVLGLGAGFGLSFLARWMLGFPTVVPAWAVWVSLLMSSGVGLVFGIYPAARAAKLDPVEAMRAD